MPTFSHYRQGSQTARFDAFPQCVTGRGFSGLESDVDAFVHVSREQPGGFLFFGDYDAFDHVCGIELFVLVVAGAVLFHEPVERFL